MISVSNIISLFIKRDTESNVDNTYTHFRTLNNGARMRIEGKHLFYDHATATAYIGREEVGTIVLTGSPGLYRIDAFRVRESMRSLGIGRFLMDEMVSDMQGTGENILTVYPHSEPYDGDAIIERHLLYSIYERYGFVMEDANADRDKLDQKMVLNIADYIFSS